MQSRAGAWDEIMRSCPDRAASSTSVVVSGSWTARGPRHPGCQVGTALPTGFDRVVRVRHPAGDGRTWVQVAASSGRQVHPGAVGKHRAAHFDGSGRSGDVDPEEGSIPPESLAAILEHCPTDHDVTYAVWVGFEDPGPTGATGMRCCPGGVAGTTCSSKRQRLRS